MIRPWHRSRLFWLGIPGLLFLLWGWLGGSWRKDSGMRWSNVIAGYSVDDVAGSLNLRRFEDLSGSGLPNGPGLRGFATWTSKHDREPSKLRWFPEAFEFSRGEVPHVFREWNVAVAYWSLLFVYLLFWISLLIGWQRRKYRLSKTPAVLPS